MSNKSDCDEIKKAALLYSVFNGRGAKGWNRTTAIPGESEICYHYITSAKGHISLHDQ